MPFSSPADGDASPTIASLLVTGLRHCEGVVAAAVPPVDCRGAAAAKVQLRDDKRIRKRHTTDS